VKTLDVDMFDERAAILEYCEGMTRFAAETEAARRQGFTRWQAMKAVRNAKRGGNSSRSRDHCASMARQQCQDDMPKMQRSAAQENRSLPERDARF